MAHRNVPIFIPHVGCPNQCVFCNQRSISGCERFDPSNVREQIDQALQTIHKNDECEIAFFGGSFTGIDRELMCMLLDLAQTYVTKGRVQSIRLSTRPDYIDDEILSILSQYSVRHIELGLQSMNDRVLEQTKRGHTAEQARIACRKIVEAGFSLVGQMMIGLPGATSQDELDTAREICSLGAEAARIYPTVVFYDTPLCEMTLRGAYQPLSVEEAVKRSAGALRIFCEHQVPCIRIGLCATENLSDKDKVLSGPNHSALGELVWNEYYYEICKDLLQQNGLLGKQVLFKVPRREISKIVGQHRGNLVRLERETGTRVIKVLGEDTEEGIRAFPRQEF